ncbi:MAG: carbon storage regulator CsrA [Nanoarchaeota archaeon]
MLVLSRQKNESIIIGDNIEIIIVDVRGGKVKLGITAPKNISVHRKEVYEAIQLEKKSQKLAEEDLNDEPDEVDEGLSHKKKEFTDLEDGDEQDEQPQSNEQGI